MDRVKNNKETLIEGLHKITGIKLSAIREYSEYNNVFDIMDHPMTVGVTDKQYEKLSMLKDFINSYQYLRENESESRADINSSIKASEYFVSQLAFYREREIVLCAYLDSKMHILSCEKISQGTVNASFVFPREVLKRALQLDCVGIILSHNHPGGGEMPSKEDIALTKRLHNIFNPLDLKVFDHIIVADNKTFSMNEQGILFQEFAAISAKDYNAVPIQKVAEMEEEKEEELSL